MFNGGKKMTERINPISPELLETMSEKIEKKS